MAPDVKRLEKGLPSKIEELAYEFKVGEAMTRDIITVPPAATMSEVRDILRDRRISGVPVAEDRKLRGMMSLENFINCIIKGGITEKVADNMTPDVKVLYSDEPLMHAISKFDKLGYGRFPVIDRDTGKLIGIITKGDIIKCLLQKLEINYIEEEIQKYRASHIFKDINSDRTTLILRHQVPGGNYKSAGAQSSKLKVNLLRLGISPQVVRRVVVACTEAEMNIIIFTKGGKLAVYVEKDKVLVKVTDNGPGIQDIEKAMQPGFSTAPDWVREMGFGAGMGLPNMKNCSDEMRINSKLGVGTSLDLVFFLEGEK